MVPGTTVSHRHRARDAISTALRPMEAAVSAFAAAHVLDARLEQRLAIVVEEIVSNVICHAAHAHDIALTLVLEMGEAGLRVTLCDDSEPFDPREACVPELPNAERGGGVGLALVSAWTEIVAYEQVPAGNRLVLCFKPLG